MQRTASGSELDRGVVFNMKEDTCWKDMGDNTPNQLSDLVMLFEDPSEFGQMLAFLTPGESNPRQSSLLMLWKDIYMRDDVRFFPSIKYILWLLLVQEHRKSKITPTPRPEQWLKSMLKTSLLTSPTALKGLPLSELVKLPARLQLNHWYILGWR